MIADASSSPVVSHVKNAAVQNLNVQKHTKSKIKSTSKQMKINITSSISQIVIRSDGKSHRVAVW